MKLIKVNILCVFSLFFFAISGTTVAHEAWLLTPNEIAELSSAPMPKIFASHIILGVSAALGFGIILFCCFIDSKIRPIEVKTEPKLQQFALNVGPLFLRMALSIMLALAATGGLPRHGITPWTQPTFFVPDMQLSLLQGWNWLSELQIVLALYLAVGLGTRIVGLVIVFLAVLGVFLFGDKFLDYTPHFIAPGLCLYVLGAGSFSLDRYLSANKFAMPHSRINASLWRAVPVFAGIGFIYLAMMYKLTQPTLLIAILKHGEMPTFGFSYDVLALIMTGVELICGILLVIGWLIRPVALAVIVAISFLAVTLSETPLFHANLYGSLALIALMGRSLPKQHLPKQHETFA